jgi:lysophospholipase L1-like esterase
MLKRIACPWFPAVAIAFMVAAIPATSRAQSPQLLADDATRYMALGDSLAAGYKVLPATDGYAFLLYQDGIFDRLPHTLFNNVAAVGATSLDVLLYQVPEALIPVSDGGFGAQFITLTVGGDDLVSIYKFASTHPNPADVIQFANQVLTAYGQNLFKILSQLRAGLPGVKIFVANQYALPEIQAVFPLVGPIINTFNGIVAQVVGQIPSNVFLVDIHTAFLGRNGLLLVDRHGVSLFEVHLTNVGHRVMEQAFADVIDQNK